MNHTNTDLGILYVIPELIRPHGLGLGSYCCHSKQTVGSHSLGVELMPEPGTRIYIIDDDESICRALARLVKTYGYRPKTMTSGEEFVKCNNLDMGATIICDLRMPGMNGFEVYQSLECRNIKLPFIFITAIDDDPIVDQAKSIGKAFFQKPLDGQELIDILATLQKN